jgi:hypothetical protein
VPVHTLCRHIRNVTENEGLTMQSKGLTRAMFGAIAAIAMALAGAVQAAGVSGQGTWETTLLGRDIDGNAVAGNAASSVFLYDTALNITWLRGSPGSAQPGSGQSTWLEANTWAANLEVGAYDDWRLPTLTPVNGTTFNYNFTNNGTSDYGYGATGAGWGTASEMGHLFYVTLGNKGFCTPGAGGSVACVPQAGYGLTNTGDFQGLQSFDYWSGLGYVPSATDEWGAWIFSTEDGLQDFHVKPRELYALAVRPGDVAVAVTAAVPLPAAAWLMLSGLGVLGTIARRRRSRASA